MNKIKDDNIAIKKAGILNFKLLIPADSLLKFLYRFEASNMKSCIQKIPNGIAIKSQLGILYADSINLTN